MNRGLHFVAHKLIFVHYVWNLSKFQSARALATARAEAF